jgi:hypothetical protein
MPKIGVFRAYIAVFDPEKVGLERWDRYYRLGR